MGECCYRGKALSSLMAFGSRASVSTPAQMTLMFGFRSARWGGAAQVTNGLSLSTAIQCYVADNTSCNAYANFSDTAYVAGLSVLDANGKPVSGAIVSAESGTDYNSVQVPTTVPEPSTLLLMSTALLGYCIVRKRRGAS